MNVQAFTTPSSLYHKTAVVVGGMHGIGLLLSKYLADAGAQVAVVDDVDDETLQDALEKITAPEHTVIGYQNPLNTVKDLKTVAEQIVPQMGEFDIWVNSDVKDLYNQPNFIEGLIPYMHSDAVIVNFVPNNNSGITSFAPQLVELADAHHIGLHTIPLPKHSKEN